jgi:general stress protein 26
MYFSKTVLAALAGIATASSLVPDLNSTELAAVLAGAGPFITETITVTEHLAVIPMRTPRYQWLNVPIHPTCVPMSSTISEKQIVPRRCLHISPELHVSLSPEMTSSATFLTHNRRIYWHRTRKHRSTALASETSILQPTTTSELLQATIDLKAKHWDNMLTMWFEDAKETPETSVLEPTTTSELSKTTEGMKRRALQKRIKQWMSDIELLVGIQTIDPTWSVATKKWHGPYSHPKATAVASAPIEEEPVRAVDVTTEDAPVVTASALKA